MEQSLIHADIFFFISSVAVIILAIILTIFAIYAVRIVVMVSALVKKIKKESENVVDDISALREKIKEESQKASNSSFGKMISGLIVGKIFGSKRHRTEGSRAKSSKTKGSSQE